MNFVPAKVEALSSSLPEYVLVLGGTFSCVKKGAVNSGKRESVELGKIDENRHVLETADKTVAELSPKRDSAI